MKVKIEANEREAKALLEKRKIMTPIFNFKFNNSQKRLLTMMLIIVGLFVGLIVWNNTFTGNYVKKRSYDNLRTTLNNCNSYEDYKNMDAEESYLFTVKKLAPTVIIMLTLGIMIGWIFHGVGFKIIGT